MMKSKAVALLIIIVVAAIAVVQRVQGQSGGFVIEQADASKDVSVVASSSLNVLISQVTSRFVVEYANGIRYYGLAPIPSQLQTLLGGLPPRFVIEYANANRIHPIAYPLEMIGDTLPPVFSNLSAGGNGLVQWETDEYTDSELRYGTQSGNYTNILQNPMYSKVHQYQLSGLSTGITYYFNIRNADRSGNAVESAESTFAFQSQTFLPLLLRP